MNSAENIVGKGQLEQGNIGEDALPPFELIGQTESPYYEIDLLAIARPVRDIFVDRGVVTIAKIQKLFYRQGQKPPGLIETREVAKAYDRFAAELRFRHTSVETDGRYASSIVDEYRPYALISSPYRGTIYINKQLAVQCTRRGLSWADTSALSRIEAIITESGYEDLYDAYYNAGGYSLAVRLVQEAGLPIDALTLYVNLLYRWSADEQNPKPAVISSDARVRIINELGERLVMDLVLRELGEYPHQKLSRLLTNSGLEAEHIAARLGLEQEAFVDLCREFGLTIPSGIKDQRVKMGQILGTEDPKAVLERALAAHGSQRKAAIALGVSYTAVADWVKHFGLGKKK